MNNNELIPVKLPICEGTFTEFRAPSGSIDPETGRELSGLEEAKLHARELGARDAILTQNGNLSEAAKKHNSQVTRSGEGELIMGLIGIFPPGTKGPISRLEKGE